MKKLLNWALAPLLALALLLPGATLAQKISADPTASALAGGEYLAGVQTGVNVKVLPSQILTYTLANLHAVNTQTGTSYTYLSSDRAKLVTHSNAGSISAGLPQATGSFGSGWFMFVQNRGAGTLTITPTTSTIDGAATLVLTAGQGAFVISDGTNWYTSRSTQLAVAAAGSTKQVQYNAAGALGAEAGFEYDAATDILTVPNVTTSGRIITAASATGGSGFRLPHGAAPTSPTNGDMWTTSAGGLYVRINGATVGPLGAGGGGSLTNFTEAINSSTPNATVPVASLTATNAATDVDFAIVPKGAGAITAKIADNGTTNGEKRGPNSVDLQMNLNGNSAAVASGTEGFIGGGRGNKIVIGSGQAGIVAGYTNYITGGSQGGILAGRQITVSGNYAASVGGYTNSNSGTYSVLIGGTNGSITCQFCVALPGDGLILDAEYGLGSGYRTSQRGMKGAFVRNSGPPTTFQQGGRQTRWATLQADSTSATAVNLTTDGSAASTDNQFNLPSNSALSLDGQVVFRNTSTGTAGVVNVLAVCKNVSGTVTVAGTPVIGSFVGDSALSGIVVSVAADNTNKACQVKFAGLASNNISVVFEGRSAEVVN